jgi:ABC-type uncharacterized transport system permease subunit
MTTALALAGTAALAYTAAALGLARHLHAHGRERRARAPLALAGLALLAHLALHLELGGALGRPDLHFFAALSLVAAGMVALSLAGAALEHLDALGVLVFPLAALFAALYGGVGPSDAPPPALGWPILLHAWLALLAYAALALGTLVAVGLGLQERALRRRQLTGWVRVLPPLTQTEALLFRTLLASFVLLTAALLVGLVFVENLLAQHLAHKTVFSLLSWSALAALLVGHWRRGWRGALAVRWTLAAMTLLLLAYFGTRFVYDLVLA